MNLKQALIILIGCIFGYVYFVNLENNYHCEMFTTVLTILHAILGVYYLLKKNTNLSNYLLFFNVELISFHISHLLK